MRKNLVKDFKAINAQTMTAASIVGAETVINQHDTVNYVFSWSGGNTTNGNIGVEASLDGVTWFALDFGSTINTDGAAGTHQLIIETIGFNLTRPIYTRTNAAATGTLTAELFASNKGN